MSDTQPTDRPANRLAGETSPYLLQHRHNPVDWYPWGPEAIARAKAEDRPIFLSVGYSACHWCHVMERESFENPGIAALMNEHFVNVKVDREERPDIDQIYMAAVQAMTRHGGWPMSVFLTPDLEPFFGGTYFPPEDGRGMLGFPNLLQRRQRGVDEPPRTSWSPPPARSPRSCVRWATLPPADGVARTSPCSTTRRGCWRGRSTRSTAGSATRPSSRTRWT